MDPKTQQLKDKKTKRHIFVLSIILTGISAAISLTLTPQESHPPIIIAFLLPPAIIATSSWLGTGTKPSSREMMVGLFLSSSFGLGFTATVQDSQRLPYTLTAIIIIAVTLALLLSLQTIAEGNRVDINTVKTGDVYWGEVLNSNAEGGKFRPVVITNIKEDMLQVYYSTSQEKRHNHKGFVEISREGWQDNKPGHSFFNIKDPRILHVSQIRRKMGEMTQEDQIKLNIKKKQN